MQPFQVVQVTGSDTKDFETMGDKSIKQNLVCNDGEKVLIRSAMWFSYGYSDEIDPATGRETTIEHPNEVWCRYTNNSLENWKKVKLFKYEDKICINLPSIKTLTIWYKGASLVRGYQLSTKAYHVKVIQMNRTMTQSTKLII